MKVSNQRDILICGLDKLIPAKSKVVILDYPNYSNLGDILILIATKKYLKDRGCNLSAVYERRDYDISHQRRLICEDTILLIQGGGNFGDLYYSHQELRYRIIKDYSNNKIIQLPQSIYFQSSDNLFDAACKFSSHKNFHLIVRDYQSFQIANQLLPHGNSYLLPDMATYLAQPSKNKRYISRKTLYLLREDCEKKLGIKESSFYLPSKSQRNKYHIQRDWAQPTSVEKVLKSIDRILFKLRMRIFLSFKIDTFRIYSIYRHFLEAYRYQKAKYFMKGFKLVITDRLHGYIYAAINEIECQYIDNSTGKIANYLHTWKNIG